MARVLIIESDAAVARSLTQMLAAKGAQAQVTADGNEGVSLARSLKPDVIVLCVELSRVSGYSICNKLKKDPELGRIPLVLTSSQATEETFEQHKKLKTRAEAYLKKPYGEADIMALLAPYLGGARRAAHADADLGLDELSVDVDDGGLDLGDLAPAPAPRAAARPAPRAAAAPTAAARAPAAGGAEVEQLRRENRELRQKVQKLEEAVEQKDLELNDRLVQESARGREGLEAKKKVAALEREAARYKEAADQARAELEELRREAEEARLSAQSGDSEKQVLTTKIGQLVDKVKALAAERDALQEEVARLGEEKAAAGDDIDSAARARDKARKAVDIALQLIDETGLVQ